MMDAHCKPRTFAFREDMKVGDRTVRREPGAQDFGNGCKADVGNRIRENGEYRGAGGKRGLQKFAFNGRTVRSGGM